MVDRKSRAETAVARVGASAPAWLTAVSEEAKAVDTYAEMREYRVLSRLKVVQGMTRAGDLKEKHGEGACVTWPTGNLLAKPGEAFLFVPVFFYTEFTKWSDINDQNQAAIVERSRDKGGELAIKARDFDRMFEEYPGGPKDKPFKYRFVESLIFPGVLYGDGPLAGEPCTLGFQRGEFMTGKAFCTSTMMRKAEGMHVPLWAQVWKLTPAKRERNFTWFGLDYSTPNEGAYIKEEEAPTFMALHEELKGLYETDSLAVDYTDAEEDREGLADDTLD